jgi:hypothetical protein
MNEKSLVDLCRKRQKQFRSFLKDNGLSQDFVIEMCIGDISEFPETRNVAYTMHKTKKKCCIVFAPKWNVLTDDNYDAVARHEFCHALHFLFPNIFSVLKKQGLYFKEDQLEIFADKMAEIVFGDRIYYDDDLIQTLCETDCGTRPRHLTW